MSYPKIESCILEFVCIAVMRQMTVLLIPMANTSGNSAETNVLLQYSPFRPIARQTTPFVVDPPELDTMKPYKVYEQPNYVENLVQCILDGALGEAKKGAVLAINCANPEHYPAKKIMNVMIKIAAANGVSKLLIGHKGWLQKRHAMARIGRDDEHKINGFFSIKCQPASPDEEFAINFVGRNDNANSHVHALLSTIREYHTCSSKLFIDFNQIGKTTAIIQGHGQFTVEVKSFAPQEFKGKYGDLEESWMKLLIKLDQEWKEKYGDVKFSEDTLQGVGKIWRRDD